MKGNAKRRWRLSLFMLVFVLVAQTGHASTDGRYLIEFPLSSLYYGFSAITTGPDGSFWFASRIGDGTGHAKIGRMTPTGKLSEFVVPTPGPGITAIIVGPDGNIWFTEQLVGKIGRIDSSGFVEEFALPARAVGTYTLGAYPVDIVTGADRNVWFTEGSFNQIGRMDLLAQLREYPLPDFGNRPTPFELAASPDGAIWYVTADAPIWPSICRLDESGRVTQFTASHVQSLTDLAVASDGTVWYSGYSGYGLPESPVFDSRIGQLHPDGQFSEIVLANPSAAPHRIVIGPDGNVWFAEKRAIGRITPAHELAEFALAPGDFANGITLDADGNLWVAKTSLFGNPAIARLDLRLTACSHCTQFVPFRQH